MKFTEEEVSQIMWDEGIYDDNDNQLFKVVSEKIVDSDQEKSSTTTRYVIKELATGKCYSAELGKSPWYLQDEYNAKVEWLEVKPKKVTKTIYE